MRDEAYVTPVTLEQKTRGWLDQIRRSVAPRDHLRPRPPACALLIIDMLEYFAAPSGRCYLAASAAIGPRIRALLDHWRRAGWPVVFTQHGHRGAGDLGMLGKFFSDYIRAGEREARVIGDLTPLATEIVIPKTTYDAFLNTDLEAALRARNVEQVLVTGVLTHMCCETSARSAFCRGFEVFLAADATATTTEQRHLQSLLGLAESVAIVLSSAEVLAQCPTPTSSS